MRTSQASRVGASTRVDADPTNAAQPAASRPGIGKRTLVQEAIPSPAAGASATDGAVGAGGAGGAVGAGGTGGQTLPEGFRGQMERAFGADFSSVRVHEDPAAAAMGALAFTRGTEIHVAPGYYDPASQRGQALLGHELTHVVQQAQGRVRPTAQAAGGAANLDPALEREADDHGERAARGQPAGAATAGTATAGATTAGATTAGATTAGTTVTPTASTPATGAAIQYKLHKHHNGLGHNELGEELGEDDDIVVGRYLRDSETRQLYRYVSTYPDGLTIIIRSVDDGNLYAYSFDNEHVTPYNLQHHEVALGRSINNKMEDVNQDGDDPTTGVHYEHTYRQQFPGSWQDQYLGGYANPGLFDRFAPMCWRLRPGHGAAAALRAWLRGLTIAECGSTLVAIQLRSLLQVVGDWKFDQMFGSAQNGTAPSVQLLTITSNLGQCMPQQLITGAGMTDNGPRFKLGAKYYFENHPSYLHKHPDGAMSGENAVYLGSEGEAHYFSGFGIGRVTAGRMCGILLEAYNEERTEGDFRAIVLHQTSVVPRQQVEQELGLGRTFRQIYQASINLVHPMFRIGEQTRDQLTWEQWIANRSPIADEGVMLDTAQMMQLLAAHV
jgi:Domain of unknown function (DUF4157)/Protein-glutamine gamma-glutamyltransferase